MIEIRPINPSQIAAITENVRSDDFFDFQDLEEQFDESRFMLLGHFENGQAFGFTEIRLPSSRTLPEIKIEKIWNRPSFRGMGMTESLVGKLCDEISERFVSDNEISVSAEAVSAGGMRFCKEVIYEMCLRGVRVTGFVEDIAEYDQGQAEHGSFEMVFPGDPPNGDESRKQMAVFLLEQTYRNIWRGSFEARSVKAALREICAAHLKGHEVDEHHVEEVSEDALERSLRSPREGEFCRMAISLVLSMDKEMSPSP